MFEVKPEAWVEAINTFIWGQIKFIFEFTVMHLINSSALFSFREKD